MILWKRKWCSICLLPANIKPCQARAHTCLFEADLISKNQKNCSNCYAQVSKSNAIGVPGFVAKFGGGSCPVPSCPILSHPVPFCPILSHPVIFLNFSSSAGCSGCPEPSYLPSLMPSARYSPFYTSVSAFFVQYSRCGQSRTYKRRLSAATILFSSSI